MLTKHTINLSTEHLDMRIKVALYLDSVTLKLADASAKSHLVHSLTSPENLAGKKCQTCSNYIRMHGVEFKLHDQ